MICQKCGLGHMIDDSRHDLRVFKCWVCGERVYRDYPKRWGDLVCYRCGRDLDEPNSSNLCSDCARLLNSRAEELKRRTYGKTVCACGTAFERKSPTQLFHTRACRKRVTPAHP